MPASDKLILANFVVQDLVPFPPAVVVPQKPKKQPKTYFTSKLKKNHLIQVPLQSPWYGYYYFPGLKIEMTIMNFEF
jgi:hypothetical protein